MTRRRARCSGGVSGAAVLLLGVSANAAAAAPALPRPALHDPVLPAQGTKAPAEAPEDADAAPPPVLPRGANFGTAQVSASSAALTFAGAAMSLPSAAVAAPQGNAAVPADGTGSVPGARNRRLHAEADAGPPDAPPPPGARFGTGQLSFFDAEMRFPGGAMSFPGSQLASASSSFADPSAAALPGGMALREEGRGLRVTLDADVLFDFDRAELRPEAGPRLQRLMQEVSTRIPRPAFRVEGHTDWIGGDAYNLRLSARRAESVRNWLVQAAGVPRPAVSTAGYGESRPVAPNSAPDGRDDPEGRQRNRRVELLVTPR